MYREQYPVGSSGSNGACQRYAVLWVRNAMTDVLGAADDSGATE